MPKPAKSDLHRLRPHSGRKVFANCMQTISNLRRFVGGVAEFGDLLEAGGDKRLRSIGDVACGAMRYIDGELAEIEGVFAELEQIRLERDARKRAAEVQAALRD